MICDHLNIKLSYFYIYFWLDILKQIFQLHKKQNFILVKIQIQHFIIIKEITKLNK